MRQSDYGDLMQRLLVLYTPEEARQWMRSPHPQLEGRRAVDCTWAEVHRVIERLETGAYI